MTFVCSQVSPVSSDSLTHRQFIGEFSEGCLKKVEIKSLRICGFYQLLTGKGQQRYIFWSCLSHKDAMRMEEKIINVKVLRKVTISNQMSGIRISAIATRLHLTEA